MGIDPAHMPYERLAQATPPAYEQLVSAQACMAACARDFGVPSITFDEMMRDPESAHRTLEFWTRGAGGPRPDTGVEMLDAHRDASGRSSPDDAVAVTRSPVPLSRPRRPAAPRAVGSASHPLPVVPDTPPPIGSDEVVSEVEFREVFYSRVGGFEQQWLLAPDTRFPVSRV